MTPDIHLNIFICATSNFSSCAYFTVHVSACSTMAGLITVLYNDPLTLKLILRSHRTPDTVNLGYFEQWGELWEKNLFAYPAEYLHEIVKNYLYIVSSMSKYYKQLVKKWCRGSAGQINKYIKCSKLVLSILTVLYVLSPHPTPSSANADPKYVNAVTFPTSLPVD